MRTYQLTGASRNDLKLPALSRHVRQAKVGKVKIANWTRLLQQVIYIIRGTLSHTQSGLWSNPFITWSFPEFVSCVPIETIQAEMDDLIRKWLARYFSSLNSNKLTGCYTSYYSIKHTESHSRDILFQKKHLICYRKCSQECC